MKLETDSETSILSSYSDPILLCVCIVLLCCTPTCCSPDVNKVLEISTATIGVQATMTLSLSANVPSPNSNTLVVTVSCTGGSVTVTSSPITWTKGHSQNQNFKVTPTQANVWITCTYTLSGGAAGGYNAPSNTVFYVGCQVAQFSSANLGLATQVGAGLACPDRVGLAAFYPFTNGVFNKDTSAAATNAYNVGTIGFTTDPYNIANSAGVFDGSSTILLSPFIPQASIWAISFWFKTTNQNSGISCAIAVNGAWQVTGYDRCFRLNSNSVNAYIWNYESITSSSNGYADGNWHHFFYQYSQSASVGEQFYIDNVLQASGSKSYSDFTNPNYISFGLYPGVSYWQGSLDNIAMYNRLLSTAEIGLLYTSTWLDNIMCFTCPTTTGYSTTTAYPTFSITPTIAAGVPTTGGSAPTMSVNGGATVIITNAATAVANLAMGVNTLTIVAAEGTYTITVTRVCDVTSIVFTPALTLTPATIACGTYAYTASVPFTFNSLSVTITYQTTGLTHNFVVNGATVTANLGNNVASGTGNLVIYSNTVTVTAPEPNYVFTITRRCDITALTFVPALTLTPAYACDQGTFSAAVGMSVTSLAAIATFTTGSHNFQVNGFTVAYGMASGSQTSAGFLVSPSNTITISQTDGPTITLTLQRLADVSAFSFSSPQGTMTMAPPFVVGVLSGYAITVPFVLRVFSATATFSVGTVQFVVNGATIDPGMTSNQASLPGTLVGPTTYASSASNSISLISSIDGTYSISITVLPQDVRGFSLQCTTVFGATGIVIPITVSPGQMNLNATLHARYGTCQLAVTYLTAGSVTINSPSEPYSGSAAASGSYSTHVINMPAGTTLPISIVSTQDGTYSFTLTRKSWDVTAYDMIVGGGPASLWNQAALTYSPAYTQTTPYYSASVKYLMTGVSIRATCSMSVSAEIIRTGGYLVNMMPTGWTAPFTLNVGTNLIRIISANDNGNPYPSIGYSSYNFTITRTPSSMNGIAVRVNPGAVTLFIYPAFSPDIFTYTVDIGLGYTKAQFAPSFSGTNTITTVFGANLATDSITTSGSWSTLSTLITGASSVGANYWTFNSVEDGTFKVNVNRPTDVKSIVAFADGNTTPLSISPSLIPSYFSYTITVPFKTQNIQLNVNYTSASTLQNQASVSTPISPNTNTINIPTTYATPVTLTFANGNDGVYTIQIVYQPADVTAFAIQSNLGVLPLTPSYTINTYNYVAYYYGSLSNVKLTTTYNTPTPQVNVTTNGQYFGLTSSGTQYDISATLNQAIYLNTGVVTLVVTSPYDGPYTITLQPACPQPYTVTPGTSATPLCQFFASYCQQPTSGYTRVCLLTRPGCCGQSGCLC